MKFFMYTYTLCIFVQNLIIIISYVVINKKNRSPPETRPYIINYILVS